MAVDRTELPSGGSVPPRAPDLVATRSPLPYCGAALRFPNAGVNTTFGIDVSEGAVECYRRRAEAGLPVEMIEIGSTEEGDPVLAIRRLLLDGQEETFSDLTRDV